MTTDTPSSSSQEPIAHTAEMPADRAIRDLLIPHIRLIRQVAADADSAAASPDPSVAPAPERAMFWDRVAAGWAHLADLLDASGAKGFLAGDIYAGLEMLQQSAPESAFKGGGGNLFGQLLAGLPEPADFPPILTMQIALPSDAEARSVLAQAMVGMVQHGGHGAVKRGERLELPADLHLQIQPMFHHRQRAVLLWAVLLQTALVALKSQPAFERTTSGNYLMAVPGHSLMTPISAQEYAERQGTANLLAHMAGVLSAELTTMVRFWVVGCQMSTPLPEAPAAAEQANTEAAQPAPTVETEVSPRQSFEIEVSGVGTAVAALDAAEKAVDAAVQAVDAIEAAPAAPALPPAAAEQPAIEPPAVREEAVAQAEAAAVQAAPEGGAVPEAAAAPDIIMPPAPDAAGEPAYRMELIEAASACEPPLTSMPAIEAGGVTSGEPADVPVPVIEFAPVTATELVSTEVVPSASDSSPAVAPAADPIVPAETPPVADVPIDAPPAAESPAAAIEVGQPTESTSAPAEGATSSSAGEAV